MDINILDRCYNEIKENASADDTAKELWYDLLVKAIDYTVWRAKWSVMSVEEKLEKNDSRISCHNSVIIHFNMMSRYLDSIGVKHLWKIEIGENRKDIGDFATYIVFREATDNR